MVVVVGSEVVLAIRGRASSVRVFARGSVLLDRKCLLHTASAFRFFKPSRIQSTQNAAKRLSSIALIFVLSRAHDWAAGVGRVCSRQNRGSSTLPIPVGQVAQHSPVDWRLHANDRFERDDKISPCTTWQRQHPRKHGNSWSLWHHLRSAPLLPDSLMPRRAAQAL